MAADEDRGRTHRTLHAGLRAHDDRPGADLPRGLESRPITITDEAGPRNPRRPTCRATRFWCRPTTSPKSSATSSAAMAAWSIRATSCRCCCCWRRTTPSPSRRARDAAKSDAITIVLVPPAEPRTKPKACNYGLHFATGEIITIYDAEDLPEPLQLRRVVAAFASAARRRRLCAGEARVPQRPSEPPHRLVHRRIRAVVRLPAARHDAHQHVADSVGRHVESPRVMTCSIRSAPGIRSTSPRTPTSACASPRPATTPRSSTPRPSRRPTAIRSTGSGSGPVGTRATCRPGWCTSAGP